MVSAWPVIDDCCNHRLVHQGDTVLLPSVGSVHASLTYGARDTLDCALVISTICAFGMMTTVVSDLLQLSSCSHMHNV